MMVMTTVPVDDPVSNAGYVLYGLSWLFALMFVFSLFMIYRNRWVYLRRREVLDSSEYVDGKFLPYERLPSYDAMLYRFWVWDVQKFL